jgi:endonuclease-3
MPMPDLKARAAEVDKRLKKRFPDAKCSLDFRNPFELLIATILSAQSTDVRVNIVTKSLFRKYPDPRAFAEADLVEMETAVKQTGFFRNKAKAVINTSKAIMERHGGEVPHTMDELTALPGVGRKTANVVLGNAFETPVGIVVDTHVGRVSGRLGLTATADPEKIEADLMALLPRSSWTGFSHRLIYHGRETCIARKPLCEECVLNDICPSSETLSAAQGQRSPHETASAKPRGKSVRAPEGSADPELALRVRRESPSKSTARTARAARPSSKSPARSRTSQSPRGRKPSK